MGKNILDRISVQKKRDIINNNYESLLQTGDRDELHIKNWTNGLCSIYFFNDLDHFIDYWTNGYDESDKENFIKYWNNILKTVNNLSDGERKRVIGRFLDKNDYFFYLHEVNIEDGGYSYTSVGTEPLRYTLEELKQQKVNQ